MFLNIDNLDDEWMHFIKNEMKEDYFKNLEVFLESEYDNYTCYPSKKDIFKAFKLCAFNDVKVVIIGQDPYHQPNQANGLAFSVNATEKHPPSLINIFKELETDIGGSQLITGDLSGWASQGVLLLNTILTVRDSEPNSHKKSGWQTFTDNVIEQLSVSNSKIIFVLWGGEAKKKTKLINREQNIIIESGHPSPLSANRGYWFGNKTFSKINNILDVKIKW